MIWGGYITLADVLADDESESSRRSAVSRAYYGAFNLARRWLEANGVAIDHRRAHDRVWRTFKAAEHATPDTRATWRIVGELGGGLRRLRNQADYADALPGLERQAAEAVASAKRIVSLLDELDFAS